MFKIGLIATIVGALGYLYLKMKDYFSSKQVQKDETQVGADSALINAAQKGINQDEEELNALIKTYQSDSGDGTKH